MEMLVGVSPSGAGGVSLATGSCTGTFCPNIFCSGIFCVEFCNNQCIILCECFGQHALPFNER
jgi:hypothetical protein